MSHSWNYGDGRGWHRSSFSAAGDCVEVLSDGGESFLVRDSKDPDGPTLRFTRSEWRAFLLGVRAREFGDPDSL